MAKVKLTDDYIRSRARPEKGNVIDYDTITKGLAVRFTATGIPVFLFCYGSGVAGGSARRMVIGPWCDTSGKSAASVLPKMRKEAADLALMVAAKRDPHAERVAAAERDKAQRETERQERERAAADAAAAQLREARDVTVSQLCDRYLVEHGPKLRPATARAIKRRMDRHLRPAWGNRKASAITRADVAALVKPLRAAGKASEVVHVLSLVTGLFSFAVDDDELETITDNPARGLKKKVLTKAERPKPKDRALVTRREFRAFYLVTRPGRYMSADAAACLRLMMLTGCRPSEAAGIEWAEIDFHAALWNKPADAPGRSKSRRADVVPLVDDAMAIFHDRRGNGSEYVFPSGRSRRKANGGGPGVLTENRLASALRDVAPRLARLGVAPFTPHDLRRTVTTGLFDIDVSEYIVKRTLNHATRGVTDTHYNKSAFIRQRRAALELWVEYLRKTISSQRAVDNVIPFAMAGAR
jgi:integrase